MKTNIIYILYIQLKAPIKKVESIRSFKQYENNEIVLSYFFPTYFMYLIRVYELLWRSKCSILSFHNSYQNDKQKCYENQHET